MSLSKNINPSLVLVQSRKTCPFITERLLMGRKESNEQTNEPLFILSKTTTTGFKIIKLFSCSTELSMKFILLVNVKMPTIVGILTFTSRINSTSESLKVINFIIFSAFIAVEVLCSVELTSGPGLILCYEINRAVDRQASGNPI